MPDCTSPFFSLQTQTALPYVVKVQIGCVVGKCICSPMLFLDNSDSPLIVEQ